MKWMELLSFDADVIERVELQVFVFLLFLLFG